MRVPLLALAIVMTGPAWANAQTDPTGNAEDVRLAEARTHHLAGVAALQANDVPTAEREFRAALDVTFRASTAYNLALVLTDQARPSEALLLYERVLDLTDEELPRARSDIEFDQRRAAGLRALIEIALEGAEVAEVRLDDVFVGTVRATAPLSLSVDPGEHRVDAENDGERVSETLRLQAGETQRARLAFRARPVVLVHLQNGGNDGNVNEPTDGRRRRRRRIIGLVVLGIGLVAGGVALGVALSNREPNGGIEEAPFGRFDALRALR